MATQQRSRLQAQINRIAEQTGLSPSQVAAVVDQSVTEVQRVDANVKYFPVTEASPYIVPLHQLIAGSNIFGIRTAGAFTVRLPLRAREEQIITVADERGTADSDPITVEVG